MVAEVLNLLILTHVTLILAFTALFTLAVPVLTEETRVVVPSAASLAAIELGILALARRGRVMGAAWAFCVLTWLAVTLSALGQGGIESPSLIAQLTVIVLAGLLLGAKVGAGTAVLSAVSLGSLLALDSMGLLPAPQTRSTEGTTFVLLLGNIVFITVPLYLVIRRTNDWIIRARSSEREAEENLDRLMATQEQLMHAGKMEAVGRLAGGVAHDFNNILTAISGHAALLEEDHPSDAGTGEELSAIREAVDRARRLTRQLLTFSRREMLELELLDLGEMVGGMAHMLERLLTEEVQLSLSADDDLGVIKADRGQMEQVIVNLAVNAQAAMPEGGRLSIQTANLDVPSSESNTDAPPSGEYVVLVVSDTGVGMDEGTRRRVFEPFFTTKDVDEGTGLGLATVYGIVEKCGGHATVESRPGQGSRFTLYFPRLSGEPSAAPSSAETRADHSGDETILVIEDEAAVRRVLSRTLKQGGYAVLEAGSGPEALQIAAENRGSIDLVISDVVLPGGMRGPSILKKLAEEGHPMPALFISGYPDLGEEGDTLGANVELLAKPFEPSEMLTRVRRILDAV